MMENDTNTFSYCFLKLATRCSMITIVHSDTILFYPFWGQDWRFQKGSGSNHPSSYGRRSVLLYHQRLRPFLRDDHQGAPTRIASVIHNVFCYLVHAYDNFVAYWCEFFLDFLLIILHHWIIRCLLKLSRYHSPGTTTRANNILVGDWQKISLLRD